MTAESQAVRDLLAEATSTFPPDRAIDLGELGSKRLRGWSICEIWSQKLQEGPYQSGSTAWLCLTTSGALVERHTVWHEEDNHHVAYVQELRTDLTTFDHAYVSKTRPSETFWRGEEGTLTVGDYSGEKVFTKGLDGLRAKLNDSLRALKKG